MKALKVIPALSIASTLLVSCSSNLTSGSSAVKPTAKPQKTTSSSGTRAVAESIFSRINAERAKVGKKPLTGNRGLNQLAQKQANYISQNSKNS